MTKNQLENETSTYLQMHKDNPVHWFPWGAAAFEKAQKENKLIFLSSGYASCHWCHIMERESFQNTSVAEILNTSFVPVKLDREQHPDIDAYYQGIAAEYSRSEGWPLTILLTPDLSPIFGATYLPPGDAYGRPGLKTLLKRFLEAWENDRENLLRVSQTVERRQRERVSGNDSKSSELRESYFVDALRFFERTYDPQNGGFGRGQKFPAPSGLEFVFSQFLRDRNEAHKEIVLHTLSKMSISPIADLAGGGFHRYSTQPDWSLPHFEKMLSDNALLAPLYLSVGKKFDIPSFIETGKRTLAFIQNELKAPHGGFFTALDADVGEAEGLFYLWEPQELMTLVSEIAPNDAEFFFSYFRLHPQTSLGGRFSLILAQTYEAIAEKMETTPQAIFERASPILDKLAEIRKQRHPLIIDDNIVAELNGLTASAFFKAFQLLGDASYLKTGLATLEFIEQNLLSGSLLAHGICKGKLLQNGFLPDYGAVACAYLEAYSATFDPYFIKQASKIVDQAVEIFWNKNRLAFFDTAATQGHAIVPMKSTQDEPKPSGTSLITEALLRLGTLTGDDEDLVKAETCLKNQSKLFANGGLFSGKMLQNLDFFLRGPTTFTCVGDPEASPLKEMTAYMRATISPAKTMACLDPKNEKEILEFLPVLESQDLTKGPYVIVCKNKACSAPLTSLEALAKNLETH